MALKFFGVVCFIVVIYNVSSKRSELSEENLLLNYNIPKLIQHVTTRFDTTRNLTKLVKEHRVSLPDEFKSITAKNVHPVLIDILKNSASEKCVDDLFYILEDVLSQWTIKMFDSFGKPERGFLQGNFHWLGEFDECVDAYAPPKPNSTMGDFHGRYCNLQVTVHLLELPLPITIGTCIPDSCDAEMINAIVNMTTQIVFPHANTTAIKLTCNPIVKKLTTAAICVIFLLSVFILLALIGSLITTYECFSKIYTSRSVVLASGFEQRKTPSANGDIDRQSSHGDDYDVPILGYPTKDRKLPMWIEKVNPFFNCFCFFTNGAKLLDTSNSEGQLPCLHGIRFLSLSWVIVCHTYMFSVSGARNLTNILPAVDNWPFQIIMNGFYSVDSFFVLSGFLLAYLFFEAASKNNGKVPWVYFYVHRYIRLTPVYMIVLAFSATIYPYLSTGPLWTSPEIDPYCKKNWWMNLLYINNFKDSAEMCIGWSWYLANDMQFFVISPIFLIALWRFPPVGLAILAFFMNITTVANFVISYQYELPAGLASLVVLGQPQNFTIDSWTNFFNMIYVKPYARISPYLVGIALAYYLYRRRQNNYGKNSLVVLSVGWLIASTVTLACLFGLYHREMSNLEMSFYAAFNRTCFALGLAWVIYVCLTGQGGFVNSILSFKLFIPLSRLTYCAYLVHPIVMYLYYASIRSLIDFSHLTMVLLYLGFLVMSYSIAFITSLLFESPVIRLDKLVRSKLSGQ